MNQVRVTTELRLAPSVSGDQQRDELAAFAAFCAARIARHVAGVHSWDVYLVAGLDGNAEVIVRAKLDTMTVEMAATGCEPAVAIWNAMSKIEQPLRETVAALTRAA